MAYSRFSEALYKVAQSWAGKWTKYANELLLSSPTVLGTPKSLKNIIEVHTKVERKSAQRFSLVLTAKGKGKHVEDYGHGKALATAYEIGGKPHVIKPRGKRKNLIFYWEKADTVFKGASVDHPGIEAANQDRGYIVQSRYRLLKDGKRELTEAGRKAILEDLKFAFTSARTKKK